VTSAALPSSVNGACTLRSISFENMPRHACQSEASPKIDRKSLVWLYAEYRLGVFVAYAQGQSGRDLCFQRFGTL
jgi:hypothetical protein